VSQYWPFIITGIATGALYGLAAMGLVLTYKTTGIFNFAHGSIAAAAAYLFYELHVQHGMAWPLATAITIFLLSVVGGVLLERVARALAGAPASAKIVATVGLMLLIQGTAFAIYNDARPFPQFLPQHLYRFGGINVSADQIIAVVIATLAAVGLSVFFRVSRTGIAMRGVVDNPALLDLTGTSPARVRTQSWMIGNAFAALSGVLLAPKLGLDAFLLTLLVVQAFGAAAVARFTSLPLAYVGGLGIGVAGALSTKYVGAHPALAGLPYSLPFLVLFGILVFTRKGRFTETVRARRVTEQRTFRPAVTWAGRAVLLAVLIAIPHRVGARLPVYNNALIMVIVFLSLSLLVRTSGQVSLCHAGFAAVGAAVFSHLAHGAGLPWPVALVGAGLAAVPIGAIVAIPAIRIAGVYLALATFGFGILLERMAYPTSLMFGSYGTRPAPRPRLGGLDLTSDVRYYYVCLAVMLLVALISVVINRSRLGRLLRGMADSPVALATLGTAVNVSRVLVFCISAFMAGIAGGLFAAQAGQIGYIGFGAFTSIIWLAVLALAGRGEFSAAFIGAFVISVVPTYLDSPTYSKLQPVLFGAFALLAALSEGGALNVKDRVGSFVSRRADRTAERLSRSPVRDRLAPATASAGQS
jgi:branched-subunit amino acid ABC-type transport system permease component